MSFHREFSKILSRKAADQLASPKLPWFRRPAKPKSPLQELWEENVLPLYWKYWKVPHEKFAHRMMVNYLRGYGMMYDDTLNEKEPVMERAMEILPYDIRVHRYRRLMRANDLSMKKYHLPLSEQNYDPMIPYLAPYVEEAKFMMQEEQELLSYHPWDRRIFVDGTSGFGENKYVNEVSVECFSGNWAEHAKLHQILKQQKTLNMQDQKEKKLKGISAASEAVNAIKDLIVQQIGKRDGGVSALATVTSVSPNKGNFSNSSGLTNRMGSSPAPVELEAHKNSSYKGHPVTLMDKLVGRKGIVGIRFILLLGLILVLFFFLKINSLISEIPAAVERKNNRIVDSLGVQQIAGSSVGSAALVSGIEAMLPGDAKNNFVEDTSPKDPASALLIKSLRGEIDVLKKKLNESNQQKEVDGTVKRETTAETDSIDESSPSESSSPLVDAASSSLEQGGVGNVVIETPLRALGQVRKEIVDPPIQEIVGIVKNEHTVRDPSVRALRENLSSMAHRDIGL